MENGTWRLGFSSPSKYDFSDDEDNDGDYDVEVDYSCPFCTEDFDFVGLGCHIEEEHFDQAKKGSGSKSRHSDAVSQSTIDLMRKEILEISLKSLLGISSSADRSSNAAADQLLMSFVCGFSTPVETETEPSTTLADASVVDEPVDDNVLERALKICITSEDQDKQTRRSKFVQSLLQFYCLPSLMTA